MSIDTALAVAWMRAAAAELDAACARLTELDAARGDADHGVNMQRGFAAIAAQLEQEPPASPGAALLAASKVLRRTIGGTSGPLWSVALRRVGKAFGDEPEVPAERLAEGLASAAEGVGEIGGASEGENTMLDALLPAARAARAAFEDGATLARAAEAAAEAAEAGAAETAGRAAAKGRASYLGERGVGHQDPGATSAAIVVRALAAAAA
jgi:dihydroxyacetone kinase-like protein